MFTGIVQQVGKLTRRHDDAVGAHFDIDAGDLAASLAPGDSIAVNGVCLTAESIDGATVNVTAVGETLEVTTLGGLDAGAAVNLETAATPSSALGGHMVQGHVDSLGTVRGCERQGEDFVLTVELAPEAFRYAMHKGSIAIDGVSLTVIDPRPDRTIRATIVPHTLERTIVDSYVAGTRVNVEADMIGKYVFHFMSKTGEVPANDRQLETPPKE